jgi:osmotically inducible protein OsmC
MFLSALISGDGLHPESIETTATVVLESDDVGPLITSITLDSKVKCEGISQEKFDELAATAKEKCPISRLYAGTEIKLNATLL